MFDFADIFTAAGLVTLGQVILIDLTMAGDNVVIIGTLDVRPAGQGAAPGDHVRRRHGARLPDRLRAGRDRSCSRSPACSSPAGCSCSGSPTTCTASCGRSHVVAADDPDTEAVEGPPRSKTFLQAAIQVTLADLSMSLDNVLAVAGAAREHPAVLFVGLALSVTLMGLAANLVARLVQRYHWIAWVGLVVILYVALKMIWEGAHQFGRRRRCFA